MTSTSTSTWAPNLKAKEDCCEEASTLSHNFYIPCNQPATKVIYSPQDRRSYRMCDMCADHSIRNRNMRDDGAYTKGYRALPQAPTT